MVRVRESRRLRFAIRGDDQVVLAVGRSGSQGAVGVDVVEVALKREPVAVGDVPVHARAGAVALPLPVAQHEGAVAELQRPGDPAQ